MPRAALLFSLAALGGLAACAATPVTGPAAPGAAPTSITVSEQPCFGFCPVYSITITPDGHYVLDGERFTRTEGRTEGELPADRYNRMLTVLRETGFAAMPAEITHGSGACGDQVVTDLPTMIVETEGEDAHRVVWYQGCFGTPFRDDLEAMRDALRDAFNYGRLVAPPADPAKR